MTDRHCLHVIDDLTQLDGDIPLINGKTDASLHRVHPRYEPVDQDDNPHFWSSGQISRFRGVDERIPIALADPLVTPDSPTILPVSTELKRASWRRRETLT